MCQDHGSHAEGVCYGFYDFLGLHWGSLGHGSPISTLATRFVTASSLEMAVFEPSLQGCTTPNLNMTFHKPKTLNHVVNPPAKQPANSSKAHNTQHPEVGWALDVSTIISISSSIVDDYSEYDAYYDYY